jgi:hypothetical protein
MAYELARLWLYRMSPKQTIKAVEEGGLRLAGLVEVPPYHYGAVFAASQSN